MENKKELVLNMLEQMQDQTQSLVRRKVTYFARPATEMLSNANSVIDLIREMEKRENAFKALVDFLQDFGEICRVCVKREEIEAWYEIPENDLKVCPYFEKHGKEICREHALQFFLQKDGDVHE